MKIKLKEITVRELVNGYDNKGEEGVVGYGGKLNIRPAYQREFIYKDAQRDAVIDTVMKDFPLNVMYYVKNPDGTFELLDGQQRSMSICEYVSGNFSKAYRAFHNLTVDEKEQILNYKLQIYFCEGNESEKLEWFEVINTAGEKLNQQELRNAVYTGPWLSSAKKFFSRTGCAAYGLGSEYVKGSPIRQDYLEIAIHWISNGKIEDYMSSHQHDSDDSELRLYYTNVINWVKIIFPEYRKEMKGIHWGLLYNDFKDQKFDKAALEIKIKELMKDEDVTKKTGVYYYVITGDEKFLSVRAFTPNQRREAYERQQGICPQCGSEHHYELEEMEADHITPWSQGGKTSAENCQMLCKTHNRRKSDK